MDWNQDTANIIYASSGGCAGHLAASLYSLVDHNRNIRNMDIYMPSIRMCREYRERLSGIADRFHRGLYMVELDDLKNRLDFDIDTRGFNIGATARLFAPRVLLEAVTRALYLDCNTIVCQSIHPLCETDLGDCLVGMVVEPTVYEEVKTSIGLQEDDPYYNSGVPLIDLGGWCGEDALGRLLDSYKSCQGRLFVCDQDTISGVLRGKMKTLPVKYNYFTDCRYFRYVILCSLCGTYRGMGEEVYREAGKAPAVVHCLGNEEPWIAGSHNHFRKLYGYYLAKTPQRDTLKQRGKERYIYM